MNSKENALVELVQTLSLQTKIKGIIDLCNAVTLFQLFYKMIDEEDKPIFYKDYQKIHEAEEDQIYQQLKLKNLEILARSLAKYASLKEIDFKMKASLRKIASQNNLVELDLLIKSVFNLLINRKQLIQVVTTLSQETQHQMMGIFQQVMSEQNSGSKDGDLLEKISQLENQLEDKNQMHKEALEQIGFLTAENQEQKIQIISIKKEIEEFRKKNQSFQELQAIFSKKDSDIAALNQKNQQLKLLNLRQKQQYQKEINGLEKSIDSLKKSLSKYETESQLHRLKSIIEDKGKALQESTSILQEERTLLKKVRERCSVLQDKNKDLQNTKFQLSLKLEQKEIQKETLSMKLSDLEDRVRDQQDRRDSISSIRQRKSQILGLQLNARFNEIGDSSMDECPSVQCQRQRQQLNIYKNKCLELIKNNEILRGNSTDRSMIADKSQQVSLRLSNLTAQNVKLRQKMANLPTMNSTKEWEEVVNKQKRKIAYMKKTAMQFQQQRNRQSQLMISTMYEMRKIIQQNVSGPKLIQVLRKLK